MEKLKDTRILKSTTLTLPHTLQSQLALSPEIIDFIYASRQSIANILNKKDKRLLVIIGPCSIHDESVAQEYSDKLSRLANKLSEKLFIVMRTYFEKPRTVIGWKGLISDPFLDGSCQINQGLFVARKLLIEIAKKNLPAATEFLDPIIPQYISDLISWAAVGARTSESQLHREIASGLSMPVGFKNSTDGNISIAIDAVKAAQYAHHFLGISAQGEPSIFHTRGNPHAHLVLRGGRTGSNYQLEIIQDTSRKLQSEKLCPAIVVDCSHGNSQKNHLKQLEVISALQQQIEAGNTAITGLMLESNLVAGKQQLIHGKPLVYGQSITDDCISWEQTEEVLEDLAEASRIRMSTLSALTPIEN